MNATHRVTRSSSVFSLLTQFYGNLHWDTCERNEACGDKGNILRWKPERSFVRKFFVICEFLSQSYSCVLRKQFANTLFVESAKWDLGAHRGPRWKRKYPQITNGEKLTERLLSEVWLHQAEFHPSPLGRVCKSVILCFAKLYLGAYWGVWWKRHYPKIKTGKKPSVKLHCDVWMKLTELHVPLQWSVC